MTTCTRTFRVDGGDMGGDREKRGHGVYDKRQASHGGPHTPFQSRFSMFDNISRMICFPTLAGNATSKGLEPPRGETRSCIAKICQVEVGDVMGCLVFLRHWL